VAVHEKMGAPVHFPATPGDLAVRGRPLARVVVTQGAIAYTRRNASPRRRIARRSLQDILSVPIARAAQSQRHVIIPRRDARASRAFHDGNRSSLRIMEGIKTAGARRIINLLAFAGIVVIVVSGLFQGTAPQFISIAGGVLALAAWVYALVTAIQARQFGWVGILVAALLIGAALAVSTLSALDPADKTPDSVSVPQMGGLTIAFLATTYAALGAGPAIERALPTYCGAWALLTLVIGGTLVGGAIGTNIGAAAPYITTVGFHLYSIAGVLAAFAWIVGMIVSFRTGAWGWFALVVILNAIGAFMFGLFGPTRQDVLMGREAARQRRAVGLR
jgi:hypothetical protein